MTLVKAEVLLFFQLPLLVPVPDYGLWLMSKATQEREPSNTGRQCCSHGDIWSPLYYFSLYAQFIVTSKLDYNTCPCMVSLTLCIFTLLRIHTLGGLIEFCLLSPWREK